MTYVQQTWQDNQPILYPVSAARMGAIEAGVFNAHYRPSLQAYNSANQSIANSTMTTLSYDSELYDTDPSGMHSAVHPTRCTFQQSGIYLVLAIVAFAANATGVRIVQSILNGGATVLGSAVVTPAPAGFSTIVSCPFYYQATAGDYCEIQADQTSGGALNVLSSSTSSRVGCQLGASLTSF